MQRQYSEKLNEEIFTVTLAGGLRLWMMPKKGAKQTVAQLSVASGVMHKLGGQYGVGVAHMVEHLLFEKPEGDIVQRFAEMGGDVNASTGLESTEYVLTCGEEVERHISLLFELVFDGRWTEYSLEGERAIIASEISLYWDDPDWVGYYSSLSCAYGNHPIAWEIAGDYSLLETIDTGLLKSWHQTFYRPSNATLFVSGNFEARSLLEACETALIECVSGSSYFGGIDIGYLSEWPPCHQAQMGSVRLELPIRNAQVFITFPDLLTAMQKRDVRRELAFELSLDIALGPTSDAYVALYEEGLVAGDSFAADVFMESTCGYLIITAETSDPETLTCEIIRALSNSLAGVESGEDFERAKKKMYGQLVRSFETPEACVSIMDAARQLGAPSPFDYVEALQTLTQVEVLERWKEGLGHLCGGVAHIFPLGSHNGEQQ